MAHRVLPFSLDNARNKVKLPGSLDSINYEVEVTKQDKSDRKPALKKFFDHLAGIVLKEKNRKHFPKAHFDEIEKVVELRLGDA